MIIKITFNDCVILFGNSYKPWYLQVREFLLENSNKTVKDVSYSHADWIARGGLKWCAMDEFPILLRAYENRDIEEIEFLLAPKKIYTQIEQIISDIYTEGWGRRVPARLIISNERP